MKVDDYQHADSDKCPDCGGGAVCWCVDPPAKRTVPAEYKSRLGGLLEEIGATFFGEPAIRVDPSGAVHPPRQPRQFVNDGEYMANLTFDGKILLDTEGNQDPSLIAGCTSSFSIEPAHRVAELCGACLEYKDQATMDKCTCGADICAECIADGAKRCFVCSDGGSVC